LQENDCVFAEDIAGVYPEKSVGYYYGIGGFNQDNFVSFDWASPIPYDYDFFYGKYTGNAVFCFSYKELDPPFYGAVGSCERAQICNHDSGLCTGSYYNNNLTRCEDDCGEGENACMLCQ
jgi:hypothetical protein